MLRNPRNSLPTDIHLSPLRYASESRKRSSVDLHSNDPIINRKVRLEKLEAIIKSTKQYNDSLKNLCQSWTRASSRHSSLPSTPAKHDEATSAFNLKVHKLCHYMKTTLIIFSELFAQTRNKKEMLKRLHGWEDEFEDFFFDENSINLKRINKSELVSRFGLEKKTGKSASYYNKLKLLIEEVNRINEQRYDLLSQIQLAKISEKLQMIQEINDQFKRTYHGKDKHKYENMAHKTIERISGFKSKMWNTCQAVKHIQQRTGPIQINWFLRKQEKKLQHVENIFLKKEAY